MSGRAGTLLSVVLAPLWLGAALFLAAIVARSAFRVLPTRTLAGALVGDTLPPLFMGGLILGIVLIVVALPAGSPGRAARIITGVIVVACCGIGQFVINARLHAIRAQLTSPIDALAVTDPVRIAFGRLHAMSVGVLGVAMLATLFVTVWLLRLLSREG